MSEINADNHVQINSVHQKRLKQQKRVSPKLENLESGHQHHEFLPRTRLLEPLSLSMLPINTLLSSSNLSIPKTNLILTSTSFLNHGILKSAPINNSNNYHSNENIPHQPLSAISHQELTPPNTPKHSHDHVQKLEKKPTLYKTELCRSFEV